MPGVELDRDMASNASQWDPEIPMVEIAMELRNQTTPTLRFKRSNRDSGLSSMMLSLRTTESEGKSVP